MFALRQPIKFGRDIVHASDMPNMMRLMSAFVLTTLVALPTTLAQTGATAATTTAPSTTFAGNTTSSRPTTVPSSSSVGTSGPPDVYLNVPELHVGKIELDVDNLQADINLNAKVKIESAVATNNEMLTDKTMTGR